LQRLCAATDPDPAVIANRKEERRLQQDRVVAELAVIAGRPVDRLP